MEDIREWKINLIYKFLLFIILLFAPLFLINAENHADILIKKYIAIYALELFILLCSYFLYEVRIRGYYNKLIKKTIKINEKFNLKNNSYKRFMGLDSFNSFEYFFNEELDKLYNELEKYQVNYENIEKKKNEEIGSKDEELQAIKETLNSINFERVLAKDLLDRASYFFGAFQKGVHEYGSIFEELTFYIKTYFNTEELYIVKKNKNSYDHFKNLDNERSFFTKEQLDNIKNIEGNIYINSKLNKEYEFDIIYLLKTDDKIHGFIFLNLQEKAFVEKEILRHLLSKIFHMFSYITEFYYQLSKKDNSIHKLNETIHRLKKELKETDENLDVHLEQMSNMYEEIVTLYEVGKKIGKIYDKDDIEKAILNTLLEITETQFALIYYYENEKLKVSKVINLDDENILMELKEKEILDNLFFDMKKAEKAIIVNEISKLLNYQNLPDTIKNLVNNFVEAPIIVGQEIKGGVILFNKKEEFTAANVNLITSLINQMSISVQNIDYLQKEIERQKEEEQLKIASQIQSGLFPQEMPEIQDVCFYGLNIPAKAVGGDYYDLIKISDNKVIGFIADVSGKGIPAALLVSIVRTIFRMVVEEFKEHSPEEILTRINSALLKENLEGRFVTATCFMIDNEKNIIEVSSAGHDPFLFYKAFDSSISKYPSSSIVLGVMEEDYEKEVYQYEKGDIFLFYTDGVAEARKESGEFFTLEKVESILKSNGNLNAENLINKIYGELKNFVQEARQNDDITMLAIKGGSLDENA